MLMAPAAALGSVTALQGTIAMSHGQSQIMLRTAGEICVLQLLLILLSAPFGFYAVVASISAAQILYSPRSLMLILPLIDLPIMRFYSCLTTPTLSTACGLGAYYYLSQSYILGNVELMMIAMGIGAICVAADAGAQYKGLRREFDVVREIIR